MKKKTIDDAAPKTAVLYMRVSTKKQADSGYSLEEQDKELPAFCEKHSLKVVRSFTDPGKSGRSMDRPAFVEMLQYCKRYRPHFVVVTSLSRFARTVSGQGEALKKLWSYGTQVRSIAEPQIDDSPAGKFAANMVGAFNEFFSDHLSDRMQKSARATFEAGRYGRNAPLGYVNVQRPLPGAPNIVPDPVRAPLITKAFELAATGNYKTTEILQVVTADGLTTKRNKPVPIQTFNELLKNPVYIGVQRSKTYEEERPGLWEPIVDERTFKNVQLVLSGRKPTTTPYSRNNPDFPLRGTLLCHACGRPMTGGKSKGRSGKRYSYYWCKTPGCRAVRNTSADKVDTEFVDLLKQLRAAPEFEKTVVPAVERAWKASMQERLSLIKKVKAEKEEQQKLLDTLVDKYVLGTIDKEMFERTQGRYREAVEGFDEWLDQLEARHTFSELSRIFSRNVLLDVSQTWVRAPLDKRQMVQKILFPKGIKYCSSKGFLNPENGCLFNQLRELVCAESGLASPTGFEPVLPP